MKLTKKAMRIAEEAFNKALFEAALDCVSSEEMLEMAGEKTEDKEKVSDIAEILSLVDEDSVARSYFSGFRYLLHYNEEIFNECDLMAMLDEEMEMLDAEFFSSPNKAARRRTRKANRNHKVSKEDRKRNAEIRGNRLYNGVYTPVRNIKKSVSNQRRAADAKCIKNLLALEIQEQAEVMQEYYDYLTMDDERYFEECEALDWGGSENNCEKYTASKGTYFPFIVRNSVGEIVFFCKTKEEADAFIQSFSIEEV